MKPVLLLGLAGCVALDPPRVEPNKLTAPSVRAVWTADATVRTRVEFRAANGSSWATAWQDTGSDEVSATLLGLPPATSGTAEVVGDDGTRSDSLSFQTPSVPAGLAPLSLTGEPGWTGFIVVAMLGSAHTMVVADEGGTILWTADIGTDPLVGGRPRLRDDGRGLWIGEFNPQPLLRSVAWDGRSLLHRSLPGFSHDMVEYAPDKLAWIAEECQADDVGPLCVNNIREGTSEGEPTTVWVATDDYDPAVDGERTDHGDWMHANSLELSETGDSLWLGLRNEDAMAEITLESGEILRQVGGDATDYAPGPGAATSGQHRFVVSGDEIVVFDNRLEDPLGSRVARLHLDDAAHTVTLVDEYVPSPPRLNSALGDVNPGADGGVLSTWTTSGLIDDVGPDGVLRAELSTELGVYLGYTLRLDAPPGVVAVE